jgi:hypothetical protein
MDRQEFDRVLGKIAKEVDDLIATREDHKKFVEQCRSFDGMVEKSNKAHAALQKKARATGKDVEEPADFPVRPGAWFVLPVPDSKVGHIVTVNGVVNKGKQRPPTDAERLMCRYVRLAAVHDALCSQQEDRRIYFTEDQLKTFPQFMLKWYDVYSVWCSEHARLTESALRDVKKDIEPAEKKAGSAETVDLEAVWSSLDITEKKIVKVLGKKKALQGKEIAKKLKCKIGGSLRGRLSRLVDRNILTNTQNEGYSLAPAYHALLSQKD